MIPWLHPGMPFPPVATALAALIRQTYGADQVTGISRSGDCSTLPSEHAEGRAVQPVRCGRVHTLDVQLHVRARPGGCAMGGGGGSD